MLSKLGLLIISDGLWLFFAGIVAVEFFLSCQGVMSGGYMSLSRGILSCQGIVSGGYMPLSGVCQVVH